MMQQPRQLDEFELGETLGVGTVGTIYRAIDRRSGNTVALKLLHPAVSRDPLILARFEREMMILEKLTHPNIVRYFGGGQVDDQLFYAMEMMEAGSLKELLQRTGRLGWREVVSCGVQLCSALQYAHNNGIIHRDLKPANLFFSKSGELKLGDFGIARDLRSDDITSHGLTVGTHAYMSPEQITGERAISGHTDLYALGCLMCEMLTGSPPFEGANFAQLFEQHLHRPAPSLRARIPDCPQALDDLIVRLLEKDPHKRPFNARAVQAALMKLLDDSPLAASVAGPDVAAGSVVEAAQELMSRRLQQVEAQYARREVSWISLAALFLAVVSVVAVLALSLR